MKRILLAILFVNTIMSVSWASGDTDPVGTPKGAFSVSPTGAATYTVSIDLPDINTQLIPQLGIVYNSQSGNGVAGWGCSLTGVSCITRGTKDLFHDEEVSGISHSSSDAYYLDGRRLILESGPEGAAGAVYRIEGDPVSSVTIMNGSSGLWFAVHTADGLDYEYGNGYNQCQRFYSHSANEHVTRSWYVNKVSNAVGDHMEYFYEHDMQSAYLSNIYYSSAAGQSASVTLTYEDRDDTQDFYFERSKGIFRKRLKNVSSSVGSSVYRSYDFGYNDTGDSSGMPYSRLTSITEKNGIGENLRPITLAWNYLPDKAQSVSTPSLTLQESTSAISYNDKYFYTGDINGDGIGDVVQISPAGDNWTYAFTYLSYRNTTGTVSYQSPRYARFPKDIVLPKLASCAQGYSVVDLDGDAKNDIFVTRINAYPNIGIYQFEIAYALGENITSSSSTLQFNYLNWNLDYSRETPLYTLTDFDNDGRTEVLYIEKSEASSNSYFFRLARWDSPYSSGFLTIPAAPQKLFSGDFNGNGLQDIIVLYSNGYTIFWNQGGTATSCPFSDSACTSANSYYLSDYDHVYMGDFNGDGLPDFLLNNENNNICYFALNTGGGTFQRSEACQLDVVDQSTNKDDERFSFLIYDIDHDGRSDAVLVKSSYVHHGGFISKNVYNNTAVRWFVSTGTSLQLFRTHTYTDGEDDARAYNLLLGDFTGNGEVDLMNYGYDLYTSGISVNSMSASRLATSQTVTDDTVAADDVHDMAAAGIVASEISMPDTLTLNGVNALTATGATRTFRLYRCYGMTVDKGKVDAITDGMGNRVGINYKPLTDGSVYTRGAGSTYPVADITPALHVVSSVTSSNGSVSDLTENYSYEGLKVHLQGRGLMGFAGTTVANAALETGTESETQWDSQFFVPRKSTVTTTMGSYTSVSETTMSIASLLNGKNHFAYPSRKEDTDFDGNTTTTTYSYITNKGTLESEFTSWGTQMYRQTEYDGYQLYGGRYLPAEVTVTQKHEDDAQPYSAKTTYTYNDQGLPLTVTTLSGTDKAATTTYTYTAGGHVESQISSWHGMSDTFSKNYLYSGGRPYQITTSPSTSTTVFDYDTFGNILSETETAGSRSLTTTYTYDGWGNPLTKTSPEGIVTTYSRGWGFNQSKKYYTEESTQGQAPVTVWYDSRGREVKTESSGLLGVAVTTTTVYDSKGQVDSRTSKEGNRTQTETFSYDSRGRVLTDYLSTGRQTSYTYGNRVVTETMAGRTYTKEYDAWGNVTESEDPVSTVRYTYNSQGKPMSVTAGTGNQGSTVTMEYDAAGNQTLLSDPDAGDQSYTYNARGQLLSQTDARGITTVNTYDALGRLSETTADGETVAYHYSTSGGTAMLLTKEERGNSYIQYGYDGYGRVTSAVRSIAGSGQYTFDYTYNSLGQLSQVSYPNGLTASYGYDSQGNRTGISVGGTQVWGVSSHSGKNTRCWFGNNDVVVEDVTRDDAGRITYKGMINSSLQTIVRPLLYTYDGQTGNITSRLGVNGSGYEYFTYDSMDRLTSVSNTAPSGQQQSMNSQIAAALGISEESVHVQDMQSLNATPDMQSIPGLQMLRAAGLQPTSASPLTVQSSIPMTITYGDNGNILSKTGIGTYSYQSQKPHAVTGVENTSSLISTATQQATYNGFGKVESITDNGYRMDFTYGPDNERWKTELYKNNVLRRTTVYAGDYEEVTTGSTSFGYCYLGDGVIALTVDGGTPYIGYAYTDNLGSILTAVSTDGTVVYNADYDAWGRQSVTSDYVGYHRGYCGHEMMPEFGLINMNGRLYDPVLGRFLSPDNYVQMPDNSQSFNRYSYCLNNPLKYTDASGELFGIDDLVAALLGGSLNVLTNIDNIHSFWQGLALFGVGAIAGEAALYSGGASVFVSAGVLSLGNDILNQGFQNGFNNLDWKQIGMNLITSEMMAVVSYGLNSLVSPQAEKLLSKIQSPVLRNMLQQSATSAFSGSAIGFMFALNDKDNDFDDALHAGWKGFLQGAEIGAISGAAAGFVEAKHNHVNPWTGKEKDSKMIPYQKGQLGVELAVENFRAQGGTGIQREVTIEVDGVRVRVDFAGYDRNGRLQLFEVKNGPYARPTRNQSIVIPKLEQGKPFVPYGRNAAYLNLKLKVPYTSDYGFNYIHYK